MPRSAILSRSLFSALLVVGVPDIITAQQPAGVFTLEQAQSGHALYNRNCAACHGIDLEGSGDAPPLAGGTFMLKWGPKMSSELFGLILQTMPVWQKYSCDIAVILHQSTKALAATHSSPGLLLPEPPSGEQKNVTLPLMVPLAMKMIDEFRQCTP